MNLAKKFTVAVIGAIMLATGVADCWGQWASAPALADVGHSLIVSCDAGHGAFGAFSQNPNSVYQGVEAHAPGQGQVGGESFGDMQPNPGNRALGQACSPGVNK